MASTLNNRDVGSSESEAIPEGFDAETYQNLQETLGLKRPDKSLWTSEDVRACISYLSKITGPQAVAVLQAIATDRDESPVMRRTARGTARRMALRAIEDQKTREAKSLSNPKSTVQEQ